MNQVIDRDEDTSEEISSERDVADMLLHFFEEAGNGNDELLEALADDRSSGLAGCSADDFGGAALMTRNEGVVLRLRSGAEFQISIVRSR